MTPEERKKYDRERYLKNKDLILSRNKRYVEKNKEWKSEYLKEYQEKYRKTEKYKEYQEKYRKTEKYKEYMRKYKQSEKYKEYLKNRRKLKTTNSVK